MSGRKAWLVPLLETLVSLCIVLYYVFKFDLSFAVVFIHLAIIVTVRLGVLAIASILSYSSASFKPSLASRLSYTGGNVLLAVSLYFTYLFSFGGQAHQQRIFTFEMMLGYAKYLNQVATNVFENPSIVYLTVFGAPVVIALLVGVYSWRYSLQLLLVREFFSNHFLRKPPLYARLNLLMLVVAIGYAVFVCSNNPKAWFRSMLLEEEPITNALYNAPIQGHYVSANAQDAGIREAYPKGLNFTKKNVVLIVVDALRPDHLSFKGYHRTTTPFLDSLYATNHLKSVDVGLSVAASTFPGVTALMSSKLWRNQGIFDYSIQQLLQDQGYNVYFFLSGDHTHFYNLRHYYERGVQSSLYLDGSNTERFVINDDRIVLEGLDKLEPYQNPSYFHIHLNSAHPSGIKQPQFAKYQPAKRQTHQTQEYTNNYDNGILQADFIISQVFSRLKQKGYLQNSLVIITADHGEGLTTVRIGHGLDVYTDQLLVPILIYDTDSVAYKGLDNATLLDVAPTIVGRLGLPVPTSWEGESLLKLTSRKYSHHIWKDYLAIVNYEGKGVLKYIYNSKKGTEEVYNLTKDLFEQENIIESIDPNVLKSFRKERKLYARN